MQDFTTYDYNITIEQLKKAMELVDSEILVEINHEYYTLIEEAKKDIPVTHHINFNR